ncbi:hypothetical protein T492DRAFT_982785 [Pavlovales sp. CCMP2436]|nr:hypothetical protein T492DRAFT_982785 [Pavlovales sp. CCMP2436]
MSDEEPRPMGLAELPFDMLVEIALCVAEPPHALYVGAFASACRGFAAIIGTRVFWQRMEQRMRALYPVLNNEEGVGLAGGLASASRYSGAHGQEFSWRCFHVARLAAALRADCNLKPGGGQSFSLKPDELGGALGGGRCGGLGPGTLGREGELESTALAELAGWAIGGKDLRGYRCRDHMYSARVSLGMLAEPERWPNALMALSVLRRGEVYEVRKVVLEVAHTQPLV